MLSFENDYITGAHPRVLEQLLQTNLTPVPGYGNDPYCESAKEKIRTACSCPEADIFFLVGGTQANAVVISSLLKPYEGVVAAVTGHISQHEAGAIEYTGTKVLELPHSQGKLQAESLRRYLETFYADEAHEHMVFPGMVYLSHPTEYGTLYSKAELTELSCLCHEYRIPLYLDGARLGYALASRSTDVTLADIAALTDVFYIGGTKVGALCGEAVVFTKNNYPRHFVNLVKKHGALLAKGRLLGVQFDALFTDNLYYEIGKHAIDLAERMKEVFSEKGYSFLIDSPTNQQFIIMENQQMEKLRDKVSFSFWEKYDEARTVVRFVTTWSTAAEDVEALQKLL